MAPIVKYYYGEKMFQQAYTYLKKIQEKRENVNSFLPKEMVIEIL